MKSLIIIGFLCLAVQCSQAQYISFDELRKGYQNLAEGGNEFQKYLNDNGFSHVAEDEDTEVWGSYLAEVGPNLNITVLWKADTSGNEELTIFVLSEFNSSFESYPCDYLEKEIKDSCEYEGTREYPPALSKAAGKYYESYKHKSGLQFGISIKDKTKYIRVDTGTPSDTN